MFAQRLNVVSGEYEWVPVAADGDGDPADDSSAFVAASSYLDMVNDTYRNRAYLAGLRAAVRPGHHVLDIGTGTGLLAMMAARLAGGDAGSVTACEVFPPMASLAKRVVAANGLSDAVSVLPHRSNDLGVAGEAAREGGAAPAACLPRRADVLVTEIFDSELLGEGLLPTLRHAVPALLQAGAAVVPASARCFFQLVESSWLERCSPPPFPAGGAPGSGDLQTMRALHLPPEHVRPLAPPVELLSFQLRRPPAVDRTESAEVAATAAGRAVALAFWWQLAMDEAATVLLSTAPPWITDPAEGGDGGMELGPPPGCRQQWRDHWKSCWCPLAAPFQVAPGDVLRVTAHHDELNVFASAERLSAAAPGTAAAPGDDVHPELVTAREMAGSTPNRICRLRERAAWEALATAVREAAARVQASDSPPDVAPRCAVLGDSTPLVALSAAERSIGHVTALQDNPISRRLTTEWLSGAAGEKVSTGRMQPWLLRARHQHQVDGAPAFDMAVAEPFYRSCEGLLPWAALSRFWYEVSALRDAGALPAAAPLLPAAATVRCVAVSLPELWRTRAAVDACEGLHLGVANPLLGVVGGGPAAAVETGGGDAARARGALPVLPCAVWQAGGGYAELTERFALLRFDLSRDMESQEAEVRATVCHSGPCHALVMFMEYHSSAEAALAGRPPIASGAPRLDAGPSPHVQGVQLLPAVLNLQESSAAASSQHGAARNDHICVSARWDAASGDLQVSAAITT
eukprot:jgi/Tetstr1/426726/TSEL_001663.t1